MALVAARAAGRTAHLVAGAQLAAADLGRRDIDVLARLAAGIHAHEAAAVGQHVEHTGRDRLVGDLVLHDLRLLLRGGRRAAAPIATPAPSGALERLLGRNLVRLGVGGALRSVVGGALGGV